MKGKELWTLAVVLMVSVLLTVLPPAYGTKPPKPSLLTEEELAFAAAVDKGDYAYYVDEKLAYDFGNMVDDQGRELWRNPGSPAEEEAADWLVSEMTSIGLKDAKKEPIPCHGWTFRGAYVQVVDPVNIQWYAGGQAGLPGTVQSPNADPDGSITREIVYVGLGRKQDYEALSARGIDVTDKLVAVDVQDEEMYWENFPCMQAELEGAIGLVVHWIIPGYQDLEGSVTCHDSEARPTIPAVCISHQDFAVLKDLCEAGSTTVKMWSDAELTIPDTGYNVVGYLPGTTHPDELIILGSIYDKYFYGAVHHTSNVAAMMQIAKALIDSGYKPDRTLVFVSVTEEYGWTDTLNAWAIGTHWLVHYNHTDWGGRARAYIGIGDSVKYDYTVRISGNPVTYKWRQSMLPLFDEFFTTHEPWSAYYVLATTSVGYLPSTWTDAFSHATVGITGISCGSRGSPLYANVYHVSSDTVDWVSGESMAMTAIANGINTIRMDRALLAPYDFARLAGFIEGTLDVEALTGAGISMGPTTSAIRELKATGGNVWDLIKSTKTSRNADAVNALLMQTMKTIFSNLLICGGWGDTAMLRHEQYQWDSMMLGKAIATLKDGNANKAMECLRLVNGMWPAINVDYEVYYHFMIECTSPGYPGLMWGDQGREAYFTDVWHEYFSIQEKAAAGNTDYSAEIASLQTKYGTAVANLKDSVDILVTTLSTANNLLETVQALLK